MRITDNNTPPEYMLFSLVMMINLYTGGSTLDPEIMLDQQLDHPIQDQFIRIRSGLVAFEMHHGVEIPKHLIHKHCTLREMASAVLDQTRIQDELFDSYLDIKLTEMDQLFMEAQAVQTPVPDTLEIDPVNWHLKD